MEIVQQSQRALSSWGSSLLLDLSKFQFATRHLQLATCHTHRERDRAELCWAAQISCGLYSICVICNKQQNQRQWQWQWGRGRTRRQNYLRAKAEKVKSEEELPVPQCCKLIFVAVPAPPPMQHCRLVLCNAPVGSVANFNKFYLAASRIVCLRFLPGQSKRGKGERGGEAAAATCGFATCVALHAQLCQRL